MPPRFAAFDCPIARPCQQRLYAGARRACALALAALLAACASQPLPPWNAAGSAVPDGSAQAVQPTAPGQGAAQPYRAAVAARFAEPLTRYATPGLSAARSRPSSQREQAQWLEQAARSAQGGETRLRVAEIGRSQRGTPILALLASRAGSRSNTRPTVLLVAGQRGNAPAGVEALLVIARELAPGGLLELLLDRINVVLVPAANPDGGQSGSATTANGTDLTQDHLLLQTPEAHALAALVRDWHPVAVVDLQEYPALAPFRQKYGLIARHDLLLQYAGSANQAEFVSRAARQWLTPALQTALARAGISHDWYALPGAAADDKALYMHSPAPNALHSASGLKNAVGYLLASRGSDLGSTHMQRRVHSLVMAASQILHTSAARAQDLQQVQTFVGRETAALACRQQLDVQVRQSLEQRTVTLLDAESGTEQRVRVDWHSSLQPQSVARRARPCGYWIAPHAHAAVQRLRLLGLQVLKVAEPGQLMAERWQMPRADAHRPAAGAYVTTRGALRAEAGSFYLPMNQPLAHLASAALEPDTAYSYLAHGVLAAGEAARVMAPPSVVLEEGMD